MSLYVQIYLFLQEDDIVPDKNTVPTSTTLFPYNVKDCNWKDYQVGDMVQYSSIPSTLEQDHGKGPFKILAIFKFSCQSGTGVVIGKQISGHWMIHNDYKGHYQLPADIQKTGWHYMLDGPDVFCATHFVPVTKAA